MMTSTSASSNDVIPTAIHVSAALRVAEGLLPALQHLQETIEAKAQETDDIVKTARTHLMDAIPIRFGQELSGWAAQIALARTRLVECLPRLCLLAQGGTAVGTGINAHPKFGAKVAVLLGEHTGLQFSPASNYFEAMSTQDTAVELSGQMRVLAVCTDENRQRSALDEQRAVGGTGRKSSCRPCSRAAASCRARSIRSFRKPWRWSPHR